MVPGGENAVWQGGVPLSGDRLQVMINSIRVGRNVYPVALQVYDLDGMAGVHVPGAITRDVLKQSAAGGGWRRVGCDGGGASCWRAAASAEASGGQCGDCAARSLMEPEDLCWSG